jgi:hypothetical protein
VIAAISRVVPLVAMPARSPMTSRHHFIFVPPAFLLVVAGLIRAFVPLAAML